jgi:hypothetical protein
MMKTNVSPEAIVRFSHGTPPFLFSLWLNFILGPFWCGALCCVATADHDPPFLPLYFPSPLNSVTMLGFSIHDSNQNPSSMKLSNPAYRGVFPKLSSGRLT